MSVKPDLLQTVTDLRTQIGSDYHDKLMESIFTDASRIADESVSRSEQKAPSDL